MARLTLERLTMRFRTRRGETITALEDVSFEVKDQEFAVLVGTSGCGKSTILRLVAGLVPPSEGRVLVDGRPIAGPGADRGMVFQAYTLFPWLTVQRNVEFGPRLRQVPAGERAAIARRYLGQVGLRGFEDVYPKELSGGMMQRVAIARALANNPSLLIADEPTAQLDAETGHAVMELLRAVVRSEGVTALVATHDATLLDLADRVLELSDGAVAER
jgi:NitT/TauT family transport system ATP-binding protein